MDRTATTFGEAICMALLVASCGPPQPLAPDEGQGSAEQAQEQLPGLAEGATAAIDPARCDKAEGRLRPFVVSWDATEQTEFAAHGQDSLIAVKLDGCKLQLVTSCRIPGTYEMHATPGAFQELRVGSEDDLYAKLSFSVAELSGSLSQSRELLLRYFVRGLRRATAPVLYRDALPAGCEEATHFVVNYAAGAYELSSSAGQAAGGEVAVMGQGVGASQGKSSSVAFRGGALSACEGSGNECTAPVRLRLLEIIGGGPPADAADIYAQALTKPAAGTQPTRLTPAVVAKVIRTGQSGVEACYRGLAQSTGESGTLKVKVTFVVQPTGVVKSLKLDATGTIDREFGECMRDVFFGLRFPAGTSELSVTFPYVFGG